MKAIIRVATTLCVMTLITGCVAAVQTSAYRYPYGYAYNPYVYSYPYYPSYYYPSYYGGIGWVGVGYTTGYYNYYRHYHGYGGYRGYHGYGGGHHR